MAEQASNRQRLVRWSVSAGIVLSGFILLGLATGLFDSISWVGRRTLQVRVRVIDGDTASPILNAKSVVFDGPISMPEGPYSDAESLTPENSDITSKGALTDDDGLAVIDFEFFTSGMTGPLRRSGTIRMWDRWVRVNADGYSQVTLPLDGQSMNPRDIDDDSPVFVTVILSKQD
jgi:hypothetical protein